MSTERVTASGRAATKSFRPARLVTPGTVDLGRSSGVPDLPPSPTSPTLRSITRRWCGSPFATDASGQCSRSPELLKGAGKSSHGIHHR